MNEQRQVDVPAGVVVRCPLVGFDLRALQKCDGCAHYHGLTEMLGNDAVPIHKRFAARCAWPIDRELQQLASE